MQKNGSVRYQIDRKLSNSTGNTTFYETFIRDLLKHKSTVFVKIVFSYFDGICDERPDPQL